jgi:hypothetical protein
MALKGRRGDLNPLTCGEALLLQLAHGQGSPRVCGQPCRSAGRYLGLGLPLHQGLYLRLAKHPVKLRPGGEFRLNSLIDAYLLDAELQLPGPVQHRRGANVALFHRAQVQHLPGWCCGWPRRQKLLGGESPRRS